MSVLVIGADEITPIKAVLHAETRVSSQLLASSRF